MSRAIAPAKIAAAVTLTATAFGLVLVAETALAASPTYCALYGREYAVATVQPGAAPGMLESLQNQAYYRCLNQDEDPPLPQTSAYFGKDVNKGVAPAPANTDVGSTANARGATTAPASVAALSSSADAAPVEVVPPKPNLAPPRPAPRDTPAPRQPTPTRTTVAAANPAPVSSAPPVTNNPFAPQPWAPQPSFTTAYAEEPKPTANAVSSQPSPQPKSALSAVVDFLFPPVPPAKPAPAAATAPAAAPAPAPAQSTQVAQGSTFPRGYHGSGAAPWTPEWKAWCARNFPNSWDPQTGTVLNYGSDRRELCR